MAGPLAASTSSIKPTATLARCCLVATAAIALGLALHRVEIAALAAPFVLGPAAFFTRNTKAPTVRLELSESAAGEHEPLQALITVSADQPVELVDVELDPGDLSTTGPTRWAISLDGSADKVLACEVEADRWGRSVAGPVTVVGHSSALLGELSPSKSEIVRLDVVPGADVFEATQDVPHALVYAGEHRSPQGGAGMTFSHVRPFDPGDRLRRINWRATLKARQLHVTATHAERSTEVIVLLDTAYDVGPRGQSVLDVSVRAAAAIAEHYLSIGDMVGLAECGSRRRLLRPAPGHRQEGRIRQWLLDVRSSDRRPDADRTPWLADVRITRALVVVLTPLLDDRAAEELLAIRQRGASVIAVDTLSPDARPEIHDRVSALARRLWLLERQRVVHRLGDAGIPVAPWVSGGSLEVVLRDIARIAAAPRLVNR